MYRLLHWEKTAEASTHRSKVTGFLCWLCAAFVSQSFCFPDVIDGLLLQRAYTLLRDCLGKRYQTKSYLVKLEGERESSPFERFEWKKQLTSMEFPHILSEALTFTLTTLDLADHIFLLLEDEEDQTNFLNAGLFMSSVGDLFTTCVIAWLLAFLTPLYFVVTMLLCPRLWRVQRYNKQQKLCVKLQKGPRLSWTRIIL